MVSAPASDLNPAQRLDLSQLLRDLLDAGGRTDVGERRRELLRLLVSLTNAAAGAYFLRGGAGELEAVVRLAPGQTTDAEDATRDDLRQAGEAACAQQRLVRTGRDDRRGTTVLASSIEGVAGPIGAVALRLFLGSAPAETFATVLQFAVALAAVLERGGAEPHDRLGLQGLAGLLDEVRACPDADAAGLAVAEALADISAADHVAVGWSPAGNDRGVRLTALSGVTEFDRRADVVRALEELLEETRGSTDCRLWRVGSGEQAGVFRSAADAMNAREIWTLPLVSTGGGAIGGVALLFSDRARKGGMGCRAVAPLATALADSLDAFRRGIAEKARGGKRLGRGGRALIGFTLAASILGLMLLPVDHRLTASSVLEPEVRRFVVAPFDGVLRASRVKPGDQVEAGDVLATLDGRELELELVRLRAEHDKLSKQRDVTLAAGETAATQITELELARIQAGLELLEYRRDHLAVRSPVRGVVTQGELSREEGSPVATGQRLFELAPLDRMVAEVEVPAEDVAYFVEGAPAELTLEAFPGESFGGPVERLHPRSTIRDGRNVYLAEVELANPDLRLRPGMRGEARITVGRRSLGWVLFHRAWEKALQWLK